ncbi:MAG TPA: hypothetical protein VD930_04415 [Gemmatimonadales bacterium]|nr:hypothetical protein [Gemmatimonadales bacterium]
MLPGSPLPLASDFLVRRLFPLLHPQLSTGAWLRGATNHLRLIVQGRDRAGQVLIAGDLGLLLGRCGWVIVRLGADAVRLKSELLIRWRALQVVTATPYLPCPHRIQHLFPDAEVDGRGFRVPTHSCSPEAVLAECLRQGIPVAETRIIYRSPAPVPPVDAAPPPPLR